VRLSPGYRSRRLGCCRTSRRPRCGRCSPSGLRQARRSWPLRSSNSYLGRCSRTSERTACTALRLS